VEPVNQELSERIEACIVVELLAAEIYLMLADSFPAERGFFMDLCHEEQEHAEILTIGMGFQRVGEVPDYIVPESFLRIYESFTFVKDIKEKIENQKVSLKEALELTLQMEESVAEKHFQDVFSHAESNSYIINKLNTLQSDSKRHADKIKAFMKSKNLLD
jgi:rubrerythrin